MNVEKTCSEGLFYLLYLIKLVEGIIKQNKYYN